jgi:hypothetical protein
LTSWRSGASTGRRRRRVVSPCIAAVAVVVAVMSPCSPRGSPDVVVVAVLSPPPRGSPW